MDDRQRHNFESLINTKSTSAIRWGNQQKTRHFDMLENIAECYYKETSEVVIKMEQFLTNGKIIDLVEDYDDSIIRDGVKALIKKFLIERRNRIVKIYKERGGIKYD